MKISKNLLGVIGVPIALALATSGCATKKYAREQAGAVNTRLSEVEKKTGDQITTLGDKTQKDVSRVEERAMTADNKAAEAGRAAQAADTKAGQATQLAQGAQQLGEQNRSKIGELSQTMEATNRYKLVGSEDVLFGFNKSTLTPEAQAKLDEIAQKITGINRSVLEIEGFTDTTGSKEYNLALSRRRADAVVRYLVSHKIPLRSIHMLGLGAAEPGMEGQNAAGSTPRPTAASRREMRKQARKVVIRMYAPETSVSASNTGQMQGQ